MKRMIRKLPFFFIFFLFSFISSIYTAQAAITQPTEIKFSTPLSVQEFSVLVKTSSVKPIELHYTQGDIQGGYTVRSGETIDDAVRNFQDAHKNFLKVSIQTVKENVDKATDGSSRERMRALYNQLVAAQTKNNAGDLKIDAMKVNDGQNIKSPGNVKSSKKISLLARSRRVVHAKDNFGGAVNLQSLYHELWAPYGGTTNVRTTYTLQTFYFNNVSSFGSNSTYEHETQVYNVNFANYAGYWSSNMPSAYYDTPFADTIDNFTVGTSTASSLQTYTQYYTYMTLSAGSGSATVRIKGQKGHRTPSWCYSTWCIFADATTGTMALHTAPSGMSWQY